ncbi:hypothetical protein [Agrobacterium sp.]|uniref:hypothetical protein n=1 Tax=Agrobacterium sp. TaxID=361 RepID=UPI0028AE8F62|nr:hypothetical protein [Agrobacterium sp.]
MIEKVEATRRTARSSATRAGESMSITSEPENTWIAKRQSTINEDLRQRSLLTDVGEDNPHGKEHPDQPESDKDTDPADENRLSGESPRIGTGNLDEEVPHGEHVGYL